ncbi:hypothetical protein DAERI_060086 [Deinococcus aerius]|uniref:Uncharacterized protein n=1 Tax=Deinococcus aerius TaxID=200253 RepID=A0A2I9D591_9DEIO|nr:hypothetical protein [Deinococcus aerius]GBF05826.1 hypothetical protein DAERI_060086 [Deinococcus aerius]
MALHNLLGGLALDTTLQEAAAKLEAQRVLLLQLATQGTLEDLLTALEEQNTLLQQQQQPVLEEQRDLLGDVARDATLRELLTFMEGQKPFARTITDAMRVQIEGMPPTAVYWGNAGWTAYYGTGAPMSMDARHQQAEVSAQTFQATRSRWTIT